MDANRQNSFSFGLASIAVLAIVGLAGCSQADAGRETRASNDATTSVAPETVAVDEADLMMQVAESAPPPEPADAALAPPDSEAPALQPPTEWKSRIAPRAAFAPQMAESTATPEMQSRILRHVPDSGATSEPSGGSATPMSIAEMEQAYAAPPAPVDSPMGMRSMAMTAEPIEPAEAATAGSAEELGPVDLRRMESDEPAALGAGNPAIQTRPDGSKWVKVFYATDRDPTYLAAGQTASDATSTIAGEDAASPWRQHLPVLFCIVGTLAAAGCAYLFSYKKAGTAMLIGGAGIAAIVFGTQGTRLGWFDSTTQRAVEFGGGRSELRFGVCQVSLPPGHDRGTMESPSLLRLEWHPDPEKHVALLETIELDRDGCLAKLNEDLAQSSRKEVFVFIHGYNVSFEDAARRTGQLAHDLDFPGPAMLYSWPSQGTTAGYPVDENNVAWTVPHLKDVLTTLQSQTGADAVHVVAHSMGNRALTSAIRELHLEGKLKDEPLGQIVLAAPDVDAEVFRRDLLPAMQASAERVTLYASSYDRALVVSKTLHGYPRAGESGEGLVVAEGLETIDVSGVDLSLLGHSYYGDVVRVVDDLKTLIFENKAAAARPYLVARERQGLAYWQVAMQPPISQAPPTLTPR